MAPWYSLGNGAPRAYEVLKKGNLSARPYMIRRVLIFFGLGKEIRRQVNQSWK